MLSDLVAGYSSSEGGSDDEDKEDAAKKQAEKGAAEEEAKRKADAAGQAKPKRKLPSASAMMATAKAWGPGTQETEPEREIDSVGKKYHNVAPPQGVRAEDGVMGGGGDYIKPVTGYSLDANKVYEGKRMLGGHASGLVPRQVGGRKNVSTEDVGSWTTDKRAKKKE
uniref:Uncharacterized protein n=2 Tax=Hemiselmis andersenii TaxID=464988 RepID=A0A6U4IKP1_HEMAN|mmetsp:Transcript_29033/g.67905  ORF Transcript_29033/g.67905 Transcript_29033/m.67905 type:complete len:167 (+) Transcript_29033:29-529(+)